MDLDDLDDVDLDLDDLSLGLDDEEDEDDIEESSLTDEDSDDSMLNDIEGMDDVHGMEVEPPSNGDVAREKNKFYKKKAFKVSACLIGGAIILFIIIFAVCAAINRSGKSQQKANTNTSVHTQTTQSQQVNNPTNPSNQTVPSQQQVQQPVTQQQVAQTSQNGWIPINQENIEFTEEYIDTSFTITDIKHYIKVTTENKDIEIKSVVTGSISGLVGTYELELPYSKASRLSSGIYFNVAVQLGEYNGKKVVGEIVVR